MTTNQRSREAAYADLVSGLIDARIDVASDRFDAELENAESSGRLDPATARLLRWWQRESVRAVTEHARATIPTTLVALEKAQKEAHEAVHRADAAWTTARGVSARSTYATDPAQERGSAPTPTPAPAPVIQPEPVPVATEAPAAPPVPAPEPTPTAQPPVAQPAPESGTPEPPAPAPAPAPWSSTVAPPQAEPTAWSTLEPPNYPGAAPLGSEVAPSVAGEPAAAPSVTPEAVYPTTPGEAPSIVDLTAHEESSGSTATPASGRRRTLLAGLTVLPRTD